jgi:hypothetical protein
MSEKMRSNQITVALTREQRDFLALAAAVDCRTMAGQVRFWIEQQAALAQVEAEINKRVD